MKFWQTKWFHAVATGVVSVGAVVAHVVIPATAAVTLGPVSVPVAGLVAGGLALAASQGIVPNGTITKLVQTVVK